MVNEMVRWLVGWLVNTGTIRPLGGNEGLKNST